MTISGSKYAVKPQQRPGRLASLAAVGSRVGEPSPAVDLWAPVGVDQLPFDLVNSVAGQDWPRVRDQLATVMDAVTTDGVYGRQLLQLVMRLPLGIYPVFDRYKAAIAIDHGDWDGLQRCLELGLVEEAELIGVRDIVLAPVDRCEPPQTAVPHHAVLFAAYEYQYQRAVGRYRHWAQKLFSFHSDAIWSREDVPVGRHLRYRRLHDAVALSFGEAQGGRLPVAQTLARNAMTLGDPGEPMHEVALRLQYSRDHDRAWDRSEQGGHVIVPAQLPIQREACDHARHEADDDGPENVHGRPPSGVRLKTASRRGSSEWCCRSGLN